MNAMFKKFFIIFVLLSTTSYSQNQFDNILDDLVLYSNKFTDVATEAVVFQASTSWMQSPKLKEKWKFTLAVNTNIFFVPNSNRSFQIKNSDFKEFKIEGVSDNSIVNVPTAFGSVSDVYLVASTPLGEIKSRVDGVNQDQIIYPYLQAGISLPYGFEVMSKYSLKNNLKNGSYQIYGFALQYNLSQHLSKLKDKNIHIATLFSYNNEDLNVDYVPSSGTTFSLGIENLNTKINSYQWQLNASKVFKKFELMAGFVINRSFIKYSFSGDNSGTIQGLDDIFNKKAEESLNKNQTFVFGEISGRYQFTNNLFLQTTIAVKNEINTNVGIQYEFN
jgi:hypothetical protein